MRRLLLLAASNCLWLSALAPGCNRVSPPEDAGDVVHEVPEVPGADQPYDMPQLEKPSEPPSESPQRSRRLGVPSRIEVQHLSADPSPPSRRVAFLRHLGSMGQTGKRLRYLPLRWLS